MSRGHAIIVGGVTFVPDHTGALYAPDFKTLLIADLHLEQGASLARRGIHVPPFDTEATIAQLESVLAKTKPWRMVLLGDSFHDRKAHTLLPGPLHQRLLQITGEVETVWLSGNHDPEAPLGFGGVCLPEHKLDGITLRHEPTPSLTGFEIAGHLHPGATLVQRGIAMRSKCFIADDRRIIMPAFGSYTGALSVRSKPYWKLFDENRTQVWMIGKSAIHRFPLQRIA